MDSELRRRAGRLRPASSDRPGTAGGARARTGPAPARPYGWGVLLLLLATFTALLVVAHRVEQRLPPPGQLERNARAYLKPLVALGPRPCGSHPNERLAVQLIMNNLADIKKGVKGHHSFAIDHQIVSGSFKMQSLDGVTSEYANVQNIVVRLGPSTPSNHSLLVNCHFDTAISSPGASDDGISCAVMLEVMRRISSSDVRLRHNIIFLFNGAEENMLQGAHGFITQHRWAWSVRAHVNLEACGAGGRELVFQTGPGHPWLVKAYAEAAPHPFANIVGQEVFQSGIIPSDTDFRIFRDYGHIPGLDTAFIRNGYVYHTPFDDERQITPGSVQRAGENVQAVLLRLTTADDMVDAKKQEVGTMVFLDFLGLFMLTYPDWVGDIICLTVAGVTVITMLRSLRTRGLCPGRLASAVAVQLLSWTLALGVAAVIATGLDFWNATMSWYSTRAWMLGLYVAPVLGTLVTVQQGLAGWIMRKDGYDPQQLEALLYEAQRCVLLAGMAALAYFRLYSAVLLMLGLLFPTLLRSVLTETVAGIRAGPVHLAVYVISQLPTAAAMASFAVISTELFIPIMGRASNSINPDLAIGILTAAFVITISMFSLTTLALVSCHRRFSRLLLLTGLVCLALVAFTPLGFPYSTQKPHIRAQRVWLQHVERTFREQGGAVRHHDSGFMLINMDRNSPASLRTALPELETAASLGDHCETELFCGVPYYYPFRRLVYDNHMLPGPMPKLPVRLQYTTSIEERPEGIRRVHFNVTGPDHMTMQMSPRRGVTLLRWNLADGIPLTGQTFQGRPTYFLYYSWGKTSAPWVVWADFKTGPDHAAGDYLVDATINGHHIHGDGQNGAPLLALRARLPDWTVSVGFVSQLEAVRV